MSTTVPSLTTQKDDDPIVWSFSPCSPATPQSEWEENIDEDLNVDPSSFVPPPVIFAGVSSPGRFCIPLKRLSETGNKTSHFPKNLAKTKVIRRNSVSRNGTSASISPKLGPLSSVSSISNHDRPLLTDTALTPTPSTIPRRSSISKASFTRSSGLVSGSRSADMQRRSRRGAKLKNQVAELEAALDHSKAKENALKQNLNDLREQVLNKNRRLEERQKVIETLEQEHRSMKKHFRELMESTLDSSGTNSQQDNDDYEEDAEMMDEVNRQNNEQNDLTKNPPTTTVTTTMTTTSATDSCTKRQSTKKQVDNDTDVLMDNPSESSSSNRPLECSQLNTPQPGSISSNRTSTLLTSFRHETNTRTRRTRSVPPTQRKNERDQDLRSRLREAEELLETLRGTNGYAQQVLKRNSVLEKRCDELENLRDCQLREVYDDLQRCRVEQIEASTAAERFRNEAAGARQHLADLHSELQKLHEKMRRHQDAALELVEVTEALADAKEALVVRTAEAQRAGAEWEAEKQHLLRNIDLYKKLLAARGEDSREDSTALRERNAQLEEVLATTREQSAIKIRGLETELQELKNEVRALTSKADLEKRSLEDQTAQNRELEESIEHLRQQLEAFRSEADRARHDVAKLSGKSMEVEELKNQLKVERDRVASQNSQIACHLESIKDSNQRFADLVERNNVFDKLLQKQQKEKENLVTESMKTNSKLYGQAENYRKKWEASSMEVQSLKKQLEDFTEKLRLAVEREKVEKDREVRQLKDESTAYRLAIHRNADGELTKLRAQHSQEMSDLRKLKDSKLESVVKQYENYLTELKCAHERHVRDLQTGKDKDAVRAKEDISRRITETQAVWKDRITEERNRHEKEILTLTASYQNNLQNELKKKNEEIETMKRNLDTQKAEMERISLMSERRIQNEKLQREQLSARIATEARDVATIAVDEEKERGRAALLAAQGEHAKAITTLENAHAQMAEALNRKIAITNEELNGRTAENEKLMGAIASRDAALNAARSEIAKAVENAEYERKREAAAAMKEQEALEAQLVEARQIAQQLREGMNSAEEIDRLNERIQTLLMNNTELENRLKSERNLMKSQLHTKEERLQTLLAENSHTREILKRNSELEETSAKEKKEIEGLLQQQRERAAALEAEIARLTEGVAQLGYDKSQMKSDIDDKQRIIDRLSKRLEGIADRVARQSELEERIKSLVAEAANLRLQLKPSRGSSDYESEANRRYRERIRELGQELNDSNDKCKRLEDEIINMKNSVEEASKLTLELQHIKSRLESQDELVDMLKHRAAKKDELIDDLKVQLTSLLENRSSDSTDGEHEKKLEELSRKCQDLKDLQQTFEQERRSLEHRMELDRQVLTQKIDQKDRQLELLMETNKRAELCFARNVELEEMLFGLRKELDLLRREQENAHSSTEENSSTTIMNSTLQTSTIREEKLRQELDSLRSDLMQKDGEIRLLQSRNREMKSRHGQELEELSSRLKFASLENAFDSSVNGENDLIQSLIDKVSQLQEETRRLRKGRDAQLITLQAENESLRAAASNVTPARSKNDGDGNATFLESQIDTLEIERDALRLRVSELVEALRASSSVEISEVDELRQRNSDLQTTVDRLSEIVGEQERTLDIVNRHADEALRQNTTLRELTEKLDLNLGDNHVLENILKRNLELESLLQELQQNNGSGRFRVSRSSTTATVASSSSHMSEMDSNRKITSTRLVHRHSASPSLLTTTTSTTRKTTNDDMLPISSNTKHASPATTTSTSACDSSRCSPPSPALLEPQPDSAFVLSSSTRGGTAEVKYEGGINGQQTSDIKGIEIPRISLYRTIRGSLDQEDDDMEEEVRGRCKRPRTSHNQGVTPSRYMLRARSKTNSLPATGNPSAGKVIDESNS